MATVRWIHISDLHLNSDGMETELLRDELPGFLQRSLNSCDYVFCTGDIRYAPAGGFPADSAEYIKSLCRAVHVPMENLFMVPGNHDVNIYSPGRAEAIKRMYNAKDPGSSYYDSRVGKIEAADLEAIHAGQEEFRTLLASVYADVPGRLARYGDPLKPHFVIETDHFNILHVDTTLSYGEDQERDLILGTKPLYDAIKTLNVSKPAILLTHYAMASLSQDERKSVSQLLQKNHVRLWLAGHEHDHNLMPYSYLYSIQTGELRYEDRASATVLAGEYNTETGCGFIRAYTWFQEGWAEYPIIWHGYAEENKFPFSLEVLENDSEASRRARLCKTRNSRYFQQEIMAKLLPDLQCGKDLYANDGSNPLIQLLDNLWKEEKHAALLADGGMGKTTLMIDAAKKKEQQPILYLPFEQLEAQGLGIEHAVCRTLFGSENAQDKLYELAGSTVSQPALILLLDGFNELGAEAAQRYASQLKGLSLYCGLQMVVSSREDFTQRYKIPFRIAIVQELSDRQMAGVMSETELQHVKGTYTLQRLLRNPMLLLMYKQVCPIMERHQENYLPWHDPIENAEQLICNYFLAQIAVLLERVQLNGEKLLIAYKCIGYALPFMGYCLEKENRISISADEFEHVLKEAAQAANQCTFLEDQFRKIQRTYRIRFIPDIEAFDIDDFLVKEMHLIHENRELFAFPHQIYRDYMSAYWIVNSTDQESACAIWNQRKFPYYILKIIGPMAGRYWDGLAKRVADYSKGRDGKEIKNQLFNLIHAFPYTEEGGIPDYSGLDLRSMRLPDYSVIPGRISMQGARISRVSLALSEKTPAVFNCLEFSGEDEWLAGATDGMVQIWSMATGQSELFHFFGGRIAAFYFTRGSRYLLAKSANRSGEVIYVYKNDGGSWSHTGMICGAIDSRLRTMVLTGDELRFYYNNRERRYDLADGSITYDQARQHAWENPAEGEVLSIWMEKRRRHKAGRQDPAGCQARAVSHKGELTACSYNDGTMIVQRGGETFAVLARGITRLKAAAISGDGKRAVTLSQKSGGGRRKMQMWDLETKTRCGEWMCSEETGSIHLSEQGEWIIGETEGRYWIRSWADEKNVYNISGTFISNQYGKLTSYGNQVLFKNSANMLELFNLETREFSKIENIQKDSRIAAFLPNGKLIAAGGSRGCAVFSGTRDGRQLSINREEGAVTGIFCMKGQPFVALATSNQVVSIYHTGTGQRTRTLKPGAGNKMIVGHPSKDAIACSGGGSRFEIFNYFSFKTRDGKNAGKWYENVIDRKLYGNVLDMNFNETNGELVSIMSDGTIVYSHELYCRYHGSTRIITNFNVDAYDFTRVICEDGVEEDLRNNGAVFY